MTPVKRLLVLLWAPAATPVWITPHLHLAAGCSLASGWGPLAHLHRPCCWSLARQELGRGKVVCGFLTLCRKGFPA